MALVDQLMGKPMEAVAPLTGAPETYQKAVQTSYDIAQNQEKLRLANEELNLKQKEVEMEFMSKGIASLSALSKAKGKTRSFMASLVGSYFEKAGLSYNKSTLDSIVGDQEAVQTVEDIIKQSKKEGLNDMQITARLSDAFADDPERAKPTLELIKAKSQAASQFQMKASLAQYEAGAKAIQAKIDQEAKDKTEAGKYIEGFVQRNSISPDVDLFPRLQGKDSVGQANALKTYELQYGSAFKRIRDGMKEYKNVSESTRRAIDEAMHQANIAWGALDNKGAAANMRVAESLHNVAISGDRSAGKDVNVPKELSDLRKESSKVFEDDIKMLEAAEKIRKFARQKGTVTAGMLMGNFQILREGKSSVLREGEIDRMMKDQGLADRLSVLIDRYSTRKSETLGKDVRQQYENVANQMISLINSRIKDKAQPFIESGRAFGAKEDQIRRQLFDPSLQRVIYMLPGEPSVSSAKEQEAPKKPSGPLKKPSEAFVNKLRDANPALKNSANLRSFLVQRGYDPSGY
jgi:hypothetical protein